VAVGSGAGNVAVSPDGATVYVSNSNDGTVTAINTATQSATTISLAPNSAPNGLAVSPDNSTLYVTDFNNARVFVINAASGQITNVIASGNDPAAVAANPNGTSILIVNNQANTVQMSIV